MKLAIVQFAPLLGKPEETIEILKPLLQKCQGADLILLPELSNSGYHFETKQQAWDSSEKAGEGIFSLFLQKVAEDQNCTIMSGLNEREGDKLYNTAIMVDKNGLIGKYRKLHLFLNEPAFFEPGNLGLPLFDFMGEKIGILICFDWMFPELWRTLALRRASLILHPSNLVLPYAQQVIPSYSITNRIFIATANRTGSERDITFSGRSIISNPKGEFLCMLSPTHEEVVIVELDLSESHNKMITPQNHAFNDRRLDVFEDLGKLLV
jgi:predicted amidohydrolase